MIALRNMIGLLAALLTSAFVGGVLFAESKGSDVAIRLAPGTEARFGFQEVHSLTSSSEKMSGEPSTHTYITEAQIHLRMLDGTRAEVTYERMKFEAISRALKDPPSFDTGAPVEEALENPFAPALLAVVKKTILIDIAPDGRITGVTPPDVDIPDVEFAGVARQFLTPRWIIQRLQPVFCLGSVKPGAGAPEWSSSTEIPIAEGSRRPMRVDTTYRYLGEANGLLGVEAKSEATLLPTPEGARDVPATLNTFRGLGTAACDPKDGLARSFKSEWKWSLTMPRPELTATVDCVINTLIVRLN